jgi:DNA-binding NtrC family response regulator
MCNLLPVTVLYVEDDEEVLTSVVHSLESHFQTVIPCRDGKEALEKAAGHTPDIVVTDLRMPQLGGLDLIPALRKYAPDVPVIITTAFTEIPHLLRAIELGVVGFVSKPLNFDELLQVVTKASQPLIQRKEIDELRASSADVLAMYIGRGSHFGFIVRQAIDAAAGNHRVLIEGEPGTGKTRLAAIIHGISQRKNRPFITLPCGSMAPDQLELELFGKKRNCLSRFEIAARGTLVLHQLEKTPRNLQEKLLSVLEIGKYYPAGDPSPRHIECRLITTVQDRSELLDALRIWLSDQIIALRPLREMPDELPELAQRLLLEASEDLRKPVPFLSEDAFLFLATCPWPGNIREMKGVLRRAIIRSQGCITADMLKFFLSYSPAKFPLPTICIEELEKLAIAEALSRTHGKMMLAAELLGIDYQRFKRKMARYASGEV